jgi:hypothetical protein
MEKSKVVSSETAILWPEDKSQSKHTFQQNTHVPYYYLGFTAID